MRSDGTEFPVEVSIVRIGNEEPPMFAGYLRDVTARKRGEESARRLAAIVEHSSDAVVGVGLDGRILAWNPGAERLYGWSADEAIGMPISDTAPADRTDESELPGAPARSRAGRSPIIERCASARTASSSTSR